MFDIGWGELVVIGIVALIVIGPKELPTVLRTLGQWTTKIRRMASEFQGQFQEAMREAELADLKKQVDSLGDVARDLPSNFENPLETARKELEGALEDKPASAQSSAELAASPGSETGAPAQPAAGAPAANAEIPLPEPAPEVAEKDSAAAQPAPPVSEGGRAA